jgi:DNA-binding response OmpR family regulator
MSTSNPTILVVDDDERTQHMLGSMLRLEGYRVITASSGTEALEHFNHESPDLILLDIMMPEINGYDLCQRIREFSQVPIIMLTAKDSEQDTIDGLDVGADDYVTKPFLSKELLARIRASLRRTTRKWDERPSPPFRLDDLNVDFDNHRVQRGDEEIRLTATEYRLLSYLARNAGRVLTVDAILTAVWGERYYGDVHLLQSTMTNLRSKLGDNARNPQYIVTRSGIGYMMKKET